MKIICTLGFLITLLAIAFSVGLAAGLCVSVTPAAHVGASALPECVLRAARL
jgi:hypothetical protein